MHQLTNALRRVNPILLYKRKDLPNQTVQHYTALFKPGIFGLLFVMLSTSLSAQKFGSVGSTWTYQNFGSTNLGYPEVYQFRAEKDTVVDGREATVITSYELYDDGTWVSRTSEIVSSTASGDSVSVYFNGSFRLVYDFTAEVGDTIVVTNKPFNGFFIGVPYTQKRFVYKIDSIGYMNLGSEPRLVQYVSNLYPPTDTVTEWGFTDATDISSNKPGRIVKGVGSLNRFAILGTSTDITFTFDNEPDYLTCYSDSVTQINFANIDCDSLTGLYTSIEDNLDPVLATIQAYPNPVENKFTIDCTEANGCHYFLYNLTGQLLLEGQTQFQAEVEASHIPAGIYIFIASRANRDRRSFLITKL